MQDQPKNHMVKQLLDMKLTVRFVLGQVSLPIGHLLDMTQGSIIELDTKTDQPFQLRVNDRLIAEANLVSHHEKVGACISKITSSRDRLKKLISTPTLDTKS